MKVDADKMNDRLEDIELEHRNVITAFALGLIDWDTTEELLIEDDDEETAQPNKPSTERR